MTTIAMCGGTLPSALVIDAGGEFRTPIAIAVIGGLVSSTSLSLVFVSAVFILVDDLGKGIWKVFGHCVGGRDDPLDLQPVDGLRDRSLSSDPAE